MTAALMKEPLRHGLPVNTFDGPLDPREFDHIRGHVFDGNPGVTSNGSETIPAGLGPKAFDHAGIRPTLDVRPDKFCPRGSDVCRLHLGVIIDEGRDIAY